MDEPPDAAPSTGTPERPSLPTWQDSLRLSPAEIVRRRLVVVLMFRIVGLFCAIVWLVPVVSWLFEGIRDSDLFNFGYYSFRLAFAMLLLAMSGVCLWLSPKIARALVPVQARPACPACGFDLTGLTEPLCPECGMALESNARTPPSPLQFQTWLVGAVIGIRLIAILIASWQFAYLSSALYWYGTIDLASLLFYPLLGGEELARTVMVLVVLFGPGLLLWCLAPRIARRAIRVGRRQIAPTDPKL